jgi:dolichyl-diphosphooligosaccharide--protein glycosyltransferase
MGMMASIIPVLLGAAMIPVMYLTGRALRDTSTGLIAAGLMAVVAGEYTWRSFFGYVDHHSMEVLLSTIFVLCYLTLLQYPGWKEMELANLRTWSKPLLLCLLTGIVYLLGLFNMPTILLFALIIGIFTLVQGITDYFRGQPLTYLLVMNGILFSVVIIGFLLFGVKTATLSLDMYSMAHVYVYLILIIMTLLLYALSVLIPGKRLLFILLLIGAGLLTIVISFVVLPGFGRMILSGAGAFFGTVGQSVHITEMRPWDPVRAFAVFNVGLILMTAGFLVLLYDIIRTKLAVSLFVLIWGAMMFFATIQHMRYEYYLAVPVVLLSALAVSTAWGWGGADVTSLLRGAQGNAAPKKEKPQKKEAGVEQPSHSRAAVAVIALILLFLFAILSVSSVLVVANHLADSPEWIPDDWFRAMEWMGTNTPDTGVDYYHIYEREGFQYPDSAYGVLARWTAGHWITYIAHRIPNANPFQDHITGQADIYDFLFARDEDTALAVSNDLGTRYVVTDYGLTSPPTTGNQSSGNGTLSYNNYTPVMIQQLDPETMKVLQFFSPAYFHTMTARLHNFDGSMAEPDTAIYVEYRWENGVTEPLITRIEQLPAAEARAKAAKAGTISGSHAVAMSGFIDRPVDVVPALRHFRLVYESPTNMRQAGLGEIKSVKIFEIVEGAHIQGEGIIELPLVTNEGRKFTYRQQSENGEFVVPYATIDTGTGVRALGPYRIVGSSMTFDVQEVDVTQGRFVH